MKVDDVRPEVQGRWALMLLCIVAVALTIFSIKTDHLREADEVLHYLYAREVGSVPMNLLHVWARPLCTLLWWPLAAFSIDAVRWTSALSLIVIGWTVWKCARELGLRAPSTAVLLVLMQTMVIALLGGVWTEWPFAAMLGVWLWLRLTHRHVAAGWITGLLPLMRPEGFIVGFVDGCCALLGCWRSREGKISRFASLLGIPVGTLVWAVVAALSSGDPWWLVHHWPHDWAPGSSYGQGAVSWILTVVRDLLPWSLIPLLMAGVLRPRSRTIAPIVAVTLAVFAVHTALWATGSFGSAGYARYFLTLCPLLAILMAQGWERIGDWLPKSGIRRHPVLALLVIWVLSAWTERNTWTRKAPPPDARVLTRVGESLQRAFPKSEAHAAHPFFYLGWETTPGSRFEDMGDFSEATITGLPIGAIVLVEDRLYLPSTRNVRPERLTQLGFERLDLVALGIDMSLGDTTGYPYLAGFTPSAYIRR